MPAACRILPRVLLLAAALPVGACVSMDGGAVEASWVLRNDGMAIGSCNCADPAISEMRVAVVGEDGQDRCAGRKTCTFSCGRQSGTTAFDIAPGRYAISLHPLDTSGNDLSVAAPGRATIGILPPITRDVVFGQITQVEAFEIKAGCAKTCSIGPSGCTP